MSHQTYNEIWEISDRQLRDLAITEADTEQLPDPKDRTAQFEYYSLLYMKYIQIFRNLATAYDQIVHPQKRRVLKTLVDGTMGRMLELKHVLVDIDSSDYHYFDDILTDLKLTPEDIEIEVPKYFRRENLPQLKEREKILEQVDAPEMDPRAKAAVTPPPMSREEAVQLIQAHERARQGRLRAKFMLDIRTNEMQEARRRANAKPPMTEEEAAALLQKYIRGWLARKDVKRQRREEDLLIGMAMPPPLPKDKDPVVKMKAVVMERHTTQDLHEAQYQAALENIKKKVEQVEGPDMTENMRDEIREWFVAVRDQTGKFPDFPDAETGGSKAVFDPPPPPPEEPEDDAGDDKKKDKGKKKKGSSKKGKKGKKGKGKKGKGDDEPEEPTGPPPSNYLPIITAGSGQYHSEWRKNMPDRSNQPQKHDADIIKSQKRLEVENMLRLQVDELMREELKNMKAAVEGEKKGKKGKGKKGGKKKGKKGGKKGKGGKKEKDPTADRTPASIFKELATQGIAKKIPEISIPEVVGQYSLLGTTMQKKQKDPEPSMADVRRLATIYCCLPLGSQAVHETQPVHIKSALFVGPEGVGKKSLATAIARDLGANFFDLTPENTFGKYTEKKGDNSCDRMLHMVFKMAKLYQPSVIYIGDAASLFVKKAKEFDSTRMKKELPKQMKSLGAGDRVIVIGTESNPFDADMKALTGIFQKILRIPIPDYGTRLMLWAHAIRQEAGEAAFSDDLDLSSLAKISEGYTAGSITTCVRSILTPRRIASLRVRPLRAVEMVPGLAPLLPVSVDQEEELKAWMGKTPLGKKAEKLKAGGGDDDDGGGKKKKKKSGKKKKKK